MMDFLPPAIDPSRAPIAAKRLYDPIQAFATVFTKWGGLAQAKRVRELDTHENLRAYKSGEERYIDLEAHEISWEGEDFSAKVPNGEPLFPRLHLDEGEIGLDVRAIWRWSTNSGVGLAFFRNELLPQMVNELMKLGATVRFYVDKKDSKDRILIRV